MSFLALKFIIELGLGDLEVYQSLQSESDTNFYLHITDEINLHVSDGSDCHDRSLNQM